MEDDRTPHWYIFQYVNNLTCSGIKGLSAVGQMEEHEAVHSGGRGD